MAKKKPKKKSLAALLRLRRKWTRSPKQKAHSTPHGRKGYDRKREKGELEGETEGLTG